MSRFLRSEAQKILLLINLLLVSAMSSAQLTSGSQVSILTVGPGEEVFTAFGHSALHISDANLGFDNVYNYGTFSFANGFYIKFTRGEMNFWLSVVPFQQEYYSWAILENRNVTEQILNLNLKQKNDLYNFLEKNVLPENRVYRYDYFYDNCSNRIDNALKHVLGNSIKFFPETVAKSQNNLGSPIRQLTHQYLLQDPWGELGIETCLGIDMDKKITAGQFKFLPDYLMWNYDAAKIQSNGNFVPAVKEKIILFKTTKQPNKTFLQKLSTPVFIFSIILILSIIVSVPYFHKTNFARSFDFFLFFVSGIVGLLIIYLWFFTTHHSQVNLNILWANPVNLFLAFQVFSKNHNHKLSNYYLVYSLLLVLTLVFWAVLPQKLNNAYIPICLALIIRSFINYRFQKKRV